MTRPNLEGLFTGATPADPPMSWLNGAPAEPESPATAPPAAPATAPHSAPPGPSATAPRRPATPSGPAPSAPTPSAATGQPTGLLDPIALAERYFAMMQALLDLQRDVGMRVVQQVVTLPPMNRLRR